MSYPAPAPSPGMLAAPDWGQLLHEVGIPPTDFYHQIIGAVARGSGGSVLSWADFDFEVNSDYDHLSDTDSASLIKKGMAPLDAIVWFSGRDRPQDKVITVRAEADNMPVVANNIYSGFFAWYFSLYTQGRAVGQGDPSFLTEVLSMGPGWSDRIRALSSADIEKFPDSWVKHINLQGLSAKSQNRLALGAAGHRYTSALKYIRPGDFLPDTGDGVVFIAGIRSWTKDRVWWELHPIDKSGTIINVTGSLNKLIEDCLATCVSPARLQELVTARILHHIPQVTPTHSYWRNYDLSMLPELLEPIF